MTREGVLALVRDTVTSVLGPVNDDEPLMAAGLDSLGAVELRSALEGRIGRGVQLPVSRPAKAGCVPAQQLAGCPTRLDEPNRRPVDCPPTGRASSHTPPGHAGV